MKFTDPNPAIEAEINKALAIGFGADIDAVLIASPNYFRGVMKFIDPKEIYKVANLHDTTPGILLASFIFGGLSVTDGVAIIKGSLKEMEQMK